MDLFYKFYLSEFYFFQFRIHAKYEKLLIETFRLFELRLSAQQTKEHWELPMDKRLIFYKESNSIPVSKNELGKEKLNNCNPDRNDTMYGKIDYYIEMKLLGK